MAQVNVTWGAPRIGNELAKLGIEVAVSTVAKYMRRRRKPPSQTWRAFLENHLKDLVALDFFVVPTATFGVLFGLVVLAHHRRRVVHFNATAHPTAEWTARRPSARSARRCRRALSRSSSATFRSSGCGTFAAGPRFRGASPARAPLSRARRHSTRCDEYRPSRRSRAPISPGFVHASASAKTLSLYSAVNCRLRAFAVTSVSCPTNPISALLLTVKSKLALLH